MENKIKKLEFGKWYSIEEYFNNIENLDWVLVQFKERYSDFHPLPIFVEYIKRDRVWVNHTEHDRYIVEMLEPVAFMLIEPYEEVK